MRRTHCCPSLVLIAGGVAGCAHRPTEQRADYVCRRDRHITVTYRSADTAIVQRGPRQLGMQAADTPIGARHVGLRLQSLGTRGNDDRLGTLVTRGYDGSPGDVAERCRETQRN
ncbi:hypothetical protein [Salinisphaera sp. T31B1]|uniref:hypothetical protein n=1 Tax=Salinisphaera sp. T31B1 TaxID=727963 RepID=UPI003340289E